MKLSIRWKGHGIVHNSWPVTHKKKRRVAKEEWFKEKSSENEIINIMETAGMLKRIRELAGKAHSSKMNKIERGETLIIENVTYFKYWTNTSGKLSISKYAKIWKMRYINIWSEISLGKIEKRTKRRDLMEVK